MIAHDCAIIFKNKEGSCRKHILLLHVLSKNEKICHESRAILTKNLLFLPLKHWCYMGKKRQKSARFLGRIRELILTKMCWDIFRKDLKNITSTHTVCKENNSEHNPSLLLRNCAQNFEHFLIISSRNLEFLSKKVLFPPWKSVYKRGHPELKHVSYLSPFSKGLRFLNIENTLDYRAKMSKYCPIL